VTEIPSALTQYGWADLVSDVTHLLDDRGIPRRREHDADDLVRVVAAATALLDALGVSEAPR
jgi:hypothetical protein